MSDEKKMSAKFQAGEHEFLLDLNYGLARDMRRKSGIDLVNYHNGSAVKLFLEDCDKIFQAVYLICQKQCEAKGLTEQQFADLFNAKVFEDAYTALEECVVNFCHPDKRPVLEKFLQTSKDVQRRESDMLVKKLDSPEMQNAIQAQLDKSESQIDQSLAAMTATKSD